jgi:glycosyltransferase involved in cell wall biosynthesis
MVKVLNIICDSNIGGAGRVLLNYLKYCDKAVFDVSVCLPIGSLLAQPLRDAGAAVYELGISPEKSYDRKDIGTLKTAINGINPDIVHTHGSLSGRIAARRCGKVVIYTRHSVFPPGRFVRSGPGKLLNKIINEHYADRIIAVSSAAKENLTDTGINGGLIDVVMNGVEPIRRSDDAACAALRAKYGIADGDFVCGILARLEPYKGHMLILEAAKILKDEGWRIKILIAGTGAYEDAVRIKAQELGLDDTIVFCGFISDVAPFLSILDVQLNASYGTEATSLSLLEGMSIGLPAVVSDYGGNPYVIEDGVNGLLFHSRDSGGLAGCVRRLMDDRRQLSLLKENAVRIYGERFTGQIFARNVENIYMKTLEGVRDGKKAK